MKKINKIISALASLTVAVAALTGCPSVNADSEALIDLSTFYLRGNMNNWANDALTDGALTENDDGTFSITYTAKAAEDEFAIADSGWAVKYCNGTSVAVDGAETEFASGGDNAKVTGQIPGNNYKMTITPGSSSLKIKVELAGSNSASFYIVDSVDGLVPVSYDGSKYTYEFTASGTSESLIIWSEGTYYKTSESIAAGNAAVPFVEETDISAAATTLTGLTAGKVYSLSFSSPDKGKTYTVSLAKKFLVGCTIVSGSQFSDISITWKMEDEFATAELEFTYDTSKTGWGTATPWALHNDGWGDKYCGGATIALGSDYTELPNGGENANFSGLTNGASYILKLKADADSVYAKVEAK